MMQHIQYSSVRSTNFSNQFIEKRSKEPCLLSSLSNQIACMSISSKKTQLWSGSFFSFFSAMHYVTHLSIRSTNCELKIFPLLNQIACMSISSQKPHSRFSCGFGVKCAHIHECVSISAQSKGEVGGDVQQGFWQPLLVGSRSENGFAVSKMETE